MASDEELDNDQDDSASFSARTFLKRAADEFEELNDRHAVLTKQYEEIRGMAAGRNTASLDKALADVGGNKKSADDVSIEKLAQEADKFLKDFPLKPQFDKLHELSCISSYVSIIRLTLDVGAKLKATSANGDWNAFAKIFVNDLNAGLALRLESSSCVNLRNWVLQYTDSWRKHGSSLISDLIVGHLERANIPQDALHADKRLTDEMNPLLETLHRVLASDASKTSDPFSALAEALLRPFKKRFVHHFCGGKDDLDAKENDKQSMDAIKPEWYLSIVVRWHRQFTPWIQNFAVEYGGEQKSPTLENDPDFGSTLALHFARGLVDLARRRFKFDLLRFARADPSYLPHLLDEGISFDADMNALKYPEQEAGCVDVLTEPVIFELWAKLEQAEASKCLEVFMNEPEAWALRYGDSSVRTDDVEHVDSNKVPFVTDNVLLLLTAMKHRFRLVRSNEHRRVFAQIQCTLLHDFRERLADLSHELRSPISSATGPSKNRQSSPSFASLVNTCSYVCTVLAEWQESPAYLAIRVACFDDVIDLFEHMRRNLLRDASSAILNDLAPSIEEYRRSFAFYTGRGDTNLSGQATAFLYTPLQEALSVLSQTLNRKNFLAVIRQLTPGLEKMLIERVILELRLDHKSGEELQRHLGLALNKVVFENYGVVGAASQFTRLSQYLHVASMAAGNCSLLKEAMKGKRASAEHVLSEMGIDGITAKEVEDLLQRRSDLL